MKKAGTIAAGAILLGLVGSPSSSALAGASPEPSCAGREESFEDYRERALAELVDRLADHAEWCRKKRVFVEYGRTLERILELDPDHKKARQGLGYKRRGKEWHPPKSPKTFRDYDEEALALVPARWEAAVAPLVEEHLRWVRRGELTPDQRQQALADVLRFDPQNEEVATAGVDVRAAASGVLPETLVARERRVFLKEAVRVGFEEAPEPAVGELSEKDRSLGVDFQGVVETPRLRVVYATDEEEARRVALALHAAEHVFQRLFPKRRGLPWGLSVYLMEFDSDKRAFLDNHPGIRPEQRAYYGKLGGSGIQGTLDFAFWFDDPQQRADGIVRTALGWMFMGGFAFTTEEGWAYEGFGLYLTRALVRTRLTWTASPATAVDPGSDFKLRTRLLLADTNWMDEALRVWNAGRAPELDALMTKDANELSTEDILASYVLAAYLLEGRPEELDEFLRLTGSGMPVADQIRRALGLDLATLRERVVRWLAERR